MFSEFFLRISNLPKFQPENLEVFKGLRYLSLSRCDIEDWESIESFADIESLRAMKLQQIPLLSDYTDEERFHLIVGRLPFLEELNGSTITEEHRITSERFFIRSVIFFLIATVCFPICFFFFA